MPRIEPPNPPVPTACFVVGPPGVGKTTLVKLLLPMDGAAALPGPKWTVGDGWCAAGHYTGKTFDGADTIGYTDGPAAIQYWVDNLNKKVRLTVCDGDRLSIVAHVEAMKLVCKNVVVVYLDASEQALEARRAARGSTQSASWMKGRATKAFNFSQTFPSDKRLTLDANAEPGVLAAEVRRFLTKTATSSTSGE